MFQKLNKTKLNQNKNKNKNCCIKYYTTISQCSKNYGIVRLVLTRLNVAPNMTGPISIKDSESELNFVKFQKKKILALRARCLSQRECHKLLLAMRCSPFPISPLWFRTYPVPSDHSEIPRKILIHPTAKRRGRAAKQRDWAVRLQLRGPVLLGWRWLRATMVLRKRGSALAKDDSSCI